MAGLHKRGDDWFTIYYRGNMRGVDPVKDANHTAEQSESGFELLFVQKLRGVFIDLSVPPKWRAGVIIETEYTVG